MGEGGRKTHKGNESKREGGRRGMIARERRRRKKERNESKQRKQKTKIHKRTSSTH